MCTKWKCTPLFRKQIPDLFQEQKILLEFGSFSAFLMLFFKQIKDYKRSLKSELKCSKNFSLHSSHQTIKTNKIQRNYTYVCGLIYFSLVF